MGKRKRSWVPSLKERREQAKKAKFNPGGIVFESEVAKFDFTPNWKRGEIIEFQPGDFRPQPIIEGVDFGEGGFRQITPKELRELDREEFEKARRFIEEFGHGTYTITDGAEFPTEYPPLPTEKKKSPVDDWADKWAKKNEKLGKK